jgi:hypothetical protein
VGQDLAKLLREDPMNHDFMPRCLTADNLATAMKFAGAIAGTEHVVVFDGSFGSMTVSPSLAKHLTERAPAVSQRVEEQLMPKWLRQRGIDPATVGAVSA